VPAAEALTLRVVLLKPLAESIRLDEASVAVRPDDGLVVRDMVPAKPLRLMTEMVVVHVVPVAQLIVTEVEGWMLKSVTWTWDAADVAAV
jgi:hypothetical protein